MRLRYFERKTTPEYLPWRKFMTMNATKKATAKSKAVARENPNPEKTLALIAAWREAYAAGTLPQWRIEGIEKIEGWEWGLERGAALGRGLS
jgi:hypothetical protein